MRFSISRAPLFRLLVLLLALFIVGCRCEANETKCEGGMLFQCRGPSHVFAEQWELIFDCGEFDATCRKGSFDATLPGSQPDLVFPEFFTDPRYSAKANHMCVSDSHECSGEDRVECTADQRAIVSCEAGKDGPRAVILAVRPEDFTHCVTTEDGAGFAHSEGECAEDETICASEYDIVYCRNGIFQDREECDPWTNQGCREVLDTDDNEVAVCTDAEPCDVDGKKICTSRMTYPPGGEPDTEGTGKFYLCDLSSERWRYTGCGIYTHTKCYQINDTDIECR